DRSLHVKRPTLEERAIVAARRLRMENLPCWKEPRSLRSGLASGRTSEVHPMASHPAVPDLDTLVNLFYDKPAQLGQLVEVTSDEMPPVYRGLLAHEEHMTVTVEEFHHSPVDVRVLAKKVARPHYARKILLATKNDGRVVQFGIMRI